MTNRPNRDWRLRGNTSRAVIHRLATPLEITITLEQRPDGRRALTLRAHPPTAAQENQPMATTIYKFAEGRDRASTIADLAVSLTPHKVAKMLGIAP